MVVYKDKIYIPEYWDQELVEFTLHGKKLCIHNATVDHIKPLGENGSNKLENLVAACEGCNNKRTNSGKSELRPCKTCRRKILGRRPIGNCCYQCRDNKRNRWLVSLGWIYDCENIGWIDPETGNILCGQHAAIVAGGRSYESECTIRTNIDSTAEEKDEGEST